MSERLSESAPPWTPPLDRLPDPHERPWLTVAELAGITGEGQKAIRAALDAGHLPMLRVGRYVRIPTAILLARIGIEPENTEAGASTPATATIHALTKSTGEHDYAPDTAPSTSDRPRHLDPVPRSDA